jgi:hypothetical protein
MSVAELVSTRGFENNTPNEYKYNGWNMVWTVRERGALHQVRLV